MGSTSKDFATNLCLVFLVFSQLGDVDRISMSVTYFKKCFLYLLRTWYHTVDIIINVFVQHNLFNVFHFNLNVLYIYSMTLTVCERSLCVSVCLTVCVCVCVRVFQCLHVYSVRPSGPSRRWPVVKSLYRVK